MVYRFVALEKRPTAGLGRAAFQSANAFLSLAAVAGALRTLILLPVAAAVATRRDSLVVLAMLLAGAGLGAVFLVHQPAWRRWYLLTAVGNAALAVLVLILDIDWSPSQKLEVACLVLGAALLVLSHIGWYREQERENDMVSFGLLLGCLLLGAPLTWAVLYCRFALPEKLQFDTFHTLNEVGMLAAGLLLFGAGGVTRIKSTAMTGAVLLAVYLLSLLAFLQRLQINGLWLVGIYLTIGGGVFFGLGLLLAVYRDRLLTLPQRIKRREGVFRVLNWR